jgi:hypothetical protein
MMAVEVLLSVIALGAAAIALWIDVRLRRLAPSAGRPILLHVLASFTIGWAVGPVMAAAVARGLAPGAALVICALPALVYMLLATLWLLRVTQSGLHGARG